ncbi:hypothetical protein ACIBSV_12240 [Embleya sp. NPDC050154]|uniref:hypothetical protein n=1 Tax=Embleya sp. NPDC050154 TaxID=3363988 RepID=UPI00378F964D
MRSLRTLLLGRVAPAGQGPTAPAPVEHDTHVITRVPPRSHRKPGPPRVGDDLVVPWEPIQPGRHRREDT